MPLLKPNPGDLADRKSIIELKLVHIDHHLSETTSMPNKEKGGPAITRIVASKNTGNAQPFLDELELIEAKLKSVWIPDIENKSDLIAKYDELYEQLEDVNSKLWDLEDNIRVLKSAPDKFQEQANARVAEVAFAIVDTNDKRSAIIQQINALWGMKTKEKLYNQ